MKKFISLVALLFCGFVFSQTAFASDTTLAKAVLKVNVYSYDPITGEFEGPIQSGSAVYIGSGTLITNYHVVEGAEKEVSQYVEVCMTENIKKKPNCFANVSVTKADKAADLALLQLQSAPKTLKAVKYAKASPKLGEKVRVFGYPSIGGGNITFTEGKISGFENQNLKTDATIDSGNSGGGAFGKKDELVGIPSSIKTENSTIGYVISIEKIREFLATKLTKPEQLSTEQVTKFQKHIRQIGEYYRMKGDFNNGTFHWKGYGSSGFELKFVSGSQKGMESFAYSHPKTKANIVVLYNEFSSEEYWKVNEKALEKDESRECWTLDSKKLKNQKYCVKVDEEKGETTYFMFPNGNHNLCYMYQADSDTSNLDAEAKKFFESIDVVAPTRLTTSFSKGKITMSQIPGNLLYIKNVGVEGFTDSAAPEGNRGFYVGTDTLSKLKSEKTKDYAAYAKLAREDGAKSKVLDAEYAVYQYIKLRNGVTYLKISDLYMSGKGYATAYTIPSLENGKIVEYHFVIAHESYDDKDSNESWMEEILEKQFRFTGKSFESAPFAYNQDLFDND